MGPNNAVLAESLARAAERIGDRVRARALRRAARAALTWPVEARDLVQRGESLVQLSRVGPWIATQILEVFEASPEPEDPSPLRTGFLTWTQAEPASAAFADAVRGDLQTHTVWSDGHSTVAEMAEAAHARGYDYLLLTEHSKGLPVANGLDEQRLEQHREELAAVQAGAGIRLLQGIEMNIGQHGEGDTDPGALGRLDVVLGAFHSALRRTEDQTERYLAALRNPHVDVLAHPRCRIWNFRPGLSADWPRVCAEAARLDKAVEADGYADRQDLNVDLLRIAADCGTRVSFGSDSHHVVDLGYITFAMGAAALAGIASDRVINCMPAEELVAWAREHRRRAGLMVTV